MNPDAYIPFYGDKLFRAVKGHPAYVKIAYIQAIWYYWSHNHCKGLRNNSEFLRGVCELDKDEWLVAQEIIFDNDQFFSLDSDELWHQKFAYNLWQEAKENYDKKIDRANKGARARWKGHKKSR